MFSYDQITERDGYLVDSVTGEKVVFYVCDPSKNTECAHHLCRANLIDANEDDGAFGYCGKTINPEFRKEGTQPFYAVMKDRTYLGREYIQE